MQDFFARGRCSRLVSTLLVVIGLMMAALGALPAQALERVDANTATVAKLQTITGIGPARAQGIVAERKRGPFKSLDDLQARVPGIGTKTVSKMAAAGLTVAPAPDSKAEVRGGGSVQLVKP